MKRDQWIEDANRALDAAHAYANANGLVCTHFVGKRVGWVKFVWKDDGASIKAGSMPLKALADGIRDLTAHVQDLDRKFAAQKLGLKIADSSSAA